MSDYTTFKVRVIGLQFDSSSFDEGKVAQFVADKKIRGGKPKPTYDGLYLSVKLGKGKTQMSEVQHVIKSRDPGVSYLITVDPVQKKSRSQPASGDEEK